VLAQSEQSSVAASMPGGIAAAALADDVVTLDGIATELVRSTRRGR